MQNKIQKPHSLKFSRPLAFEYISSPIPHMCPRYQVALSLFRSLLPWALCSCCAHSMWGILPSDSYLIHCFFIQASAQMSLSQEDLSWFLSVPLTMSFYPLTLLLPLFFFFFLFDLEHFSHHVAVYHTFACFISYYLSIPQECKVGSCPGCVDCDACT